MMEWGITGADLPRLVIEADSLDEALEIARMKDPRYNTGQVIKRRGARNAARTKLKAARVARGITQEQLAALAGIKRNTLIHYESGYKTFDNAFFGTILKCAIALQTPLEVLLSDPDLLKDWETYKKEFT